MDFAGDKLTFSIIIPTYNRAEKLRKCLESIQQQTFRNFEVLVCDDGSTDHSQEVVEAFKNKLDIRYFYNANWGGPAYPRNVGISNARAPWLCFLDSDDTWYPEKLKATAQFLDTHDFICHNFNVVGKINYRSRLRTHNLSKNAFQRLMTSGNTIVTSSVCIRKSILDEMNGFSLDKELVAVEDFDLWLRIAKKGYRFKVISTPLGDYWAGEGNITGVNDKQIERINSVFGRHINDLGINSELYNESLGFQYYLTARIKQMMQNYAEASSRYKKAMALGNAKVKFNALFHLVTIWRKRNKVVQD